MRQIKFRMKDYQGNWYYFGLGNAAYTTTETLGQYTGLKDKNGVEIYEGDIIEDEDETHALIVFKSGIYGFVYPPTTQGYVHHIVPLPKMEIDKNAEFRVVSNIHDNPELLNNQFDNEVNFAIKEKGEKI